MQFEKKKPSIPDAIPVKFTTAEIEWLDYQPVAEENELAYLAMMRKLMQARRDAVGDRLPASVAALPLISQDMPPTAPDSPWQAGLNWIMAMRPLGAIEREAQSEDQPMPHTATAELTPQEIDLIAIAAANELDHEGHRALDSKENQAEFEELIGHKPTTFFPDKAEYEEVGFGLDLYHNDIAAGLMDAVITYRQEDLTQQ